MATLHRPIPDFYEPTRMPNLEPQGQNSGPSHSPLTRKPVPNPSTLSDEEQDGQDSISIDAMFSQETGLSTSSPSLTTPDLAYAEFKFNDPSPELKELDGEGIPMANYERHAPSLHRPNYVTDFGHDREFDPPARPEDPPIPEPNSVRTWEGGSETTATAQKVAKQSCRRWCLDFVKRHYGLWICFIIITGFIGAMIILGTKGML